MRSFVADHRATGPADCGNYPFEPHGILVVHLHKTHERVPITADERRSGSLIHVAPSQQLVQ
jgi:hypothetical protein